MSVELDPILIAEIDSIRVPARLSIRFFQLDEGKGELVQVQRCSEFRPSLKADAIEDVVWNDDGTQSTLSHARFEDSDAVWRYGKPKITPFVKNKLQESTSDDDLCGLFFANSRRLRFMKLLDKYRS